jgi:bile acid:Na+ symporter, BASS family
MNITALANQAFGIAVFATLVAIGLRTRPDHALHLMTHWHKGARAFAALYLIVPAAMMLLCLALAMPPAVEAALIALSVSPMLPTLPNDLQKVGAEHRYGVSLEVVGALMALVAAPVAFWIVSQVERVAIHIPTDRLVLSLAQGVLLPIVVGVAVRLLAPGLANRIAEPLTKLAGLVLLVCVLVILWAYRALIWGQLDWPIVLSIAAFVAVGLLAGELLGGPAPTERSALALTAASRHIGFALAIGAAVVPQSIAAFGGTILIYFVLRGLLVLPYLKAFAAPRAAP